MIVIYTPGVWDIIHPGHLNLLQRAKLCGDYLIVGICSDRLAISHGKTPVLNEQERAKIVSQIKSVDEVIIYSDSDQSKFIKLLNIDKFVIGEQFGKQGVQEHQIAIDYCLENKIPIIRIPRTPGISSSKIKNTEKEVIIKTFWESRAKSVEHGKLDEFQATSLTADPAEAQKRKEKDLKYIKEAIKKTTTPKNKVLEIGCGTGRISLELAVIYKTVHASDFVEDFIKKAKAKSKKINFFCAAAHDFDTSIDFDCCVMAGLLVCLTDTQLEKLIKKINYIPSIVLKESIGTVGRFELATDHYSEQLGTNYTAIYRSTNEVIDIFAANGYIMKYSELIEQHREETHLRIFLFEKGKYVTGTK